MFINDDHFEHVFKGWMENKGPTLLDWAERILKVELRDFLRNQVFYYNLLKEDCKVINVPYNYITLDNPDMPEKLFKINYYLDKLKNLKDLNDLVKIIIE